MSKLVGAIQPVTDARAETLLPHWTEQTASGEDKARFQHLASGPSVHLTESSSTAKPAVQVKFSETNRNSLSSSDAFGHAKVIAALEKLRGAPKDRIPAAAAELMMLCYEYQFNVTAVSHAAKNVEESVQTMTTRA